MRYSADEIFRDFVKEGLPEEYKDIPIDTLKDVCYTPFLFLRRIMDSYVLTEVRFKYFGVFLVSPKKCKTLLERAEFRLAKGYITEEEYYKTKTMIENYFESIRKNEE